MLHPFPRTELVIIAALILCSLISATSPTSCGITPGYAHHTPDDFNSQAPDQFMVEMTMMLGSKLGSKKIKIQVTRDWSPLGADRFYALIIEKYYECSIFYRNVPNFVIQFGYASDADESAIWQSTINDDPVLISNTKGTLTFATSGEDSRSTHLFFNLQNNNFLDSQGFSPFGIVVEGFDNLKYIYNPTPSDSGGIDQGQYESGGNAWVLENYPYVSMIQSITLSDTVPGADNDSDSSNDNNSGLSQTATWVLVSLSALVIGVGVMYMVFVKFKRGQYQTMDGSETLAFQSEDNSVTIEL